MPSWIIELLRRSFLGNALPPGKPKDDTLIYVTRRDSAGKRQVANEMMLIDRLQEAGIKEVSPSELSFRD